MRVKRDFTFGTSYPECAIASMLYYIIHILSGNNPSGTLDNNRIIQKHSGYYDSKEYQQLTSNQTQFQKKQHLEFPSQRLALAYPFVFCTSTSPCKGATARDPGQRKDRSSLAACLWMDGWNETN